MIRILIADDHQIVRDGLKAILEDQNEIEIKVVGEASSGREVLRILENTAVDIAMLDIQMPELDGIETSMAIKKDFPEVKVLILSFSKDIDYINELLLDIEVAGYILKDRGAEELITAIRTIKGGKEYYSSLILEAMLKGERNEYKKKVNKEISLIKLTRREKEVLKLIAHSKTTPEIAEKLFIAPSTVETHRTNLKSKLEVKNTLGLVRWALENGYGEE